MKQILFAFAALLFVTNAAIAQEDGAKLAKQAGKALTSFNIDPTGNAEKLIEAKSKIELALQTPEGQALASAWLTKGDVYKKIIEKDRLRKMVDPKAGYSGDNDALIAFEAYQKVYNMTEAKKYEKKDAVDGIKEIQGDLINIGAIKYDAKDFDKSYQSFNAALKAHDILDANKEKSALADPVQMEEQKFYTGYVATLAKRNKDAHDIYMELYTKGTTRAAVYEGLYNMKAEMGDQAAANNILAEGRKKFPDDNSLLFIEINQYLKEGKLDQLTGKLKEALAKEPNNIGLYSTLGNVYENLSSIEFKAKNDAKGNEYLAESMKYYNEGIVKDPLNVDLNYALGALYYNKAAAKTQELNALPEDYSTAGMKKYEGMKKEINDFFDQALPYFQKAESLDANDLNTLIALSEIYARREDEKLAPEFKKRMDTVRSGGKNDGSYFKK